MEQKQNTPEYGKNLGLSIFSDDHKKTPFEVFHIAEDDPQKYEKLCDEMSLRDDSFITDMWTPSIYDRYYVAIRLLEPKTMQEQFLEMLKDEDYFVSKSAKNSYALFKKQMSQIGAEEVTKYDWSIMSSVCMERDLREDLTLSTNIRDLASYLGNINFEGSPEEAKVSKEQEDKIRHILFYGPKKEIEEREIE